MAARKVFPLAFVLAVLVFAFTPAANATDAEPSPSPSATASADPTAEPAEDSPLVELQPGLTNEQTGSTVAEAACGDTTPCRVELSEDQWKVAAYGLGFLVLFIAAHTIGSWRHGRNA